MGALPLVLAFGLVAMSGLSVASVPCDDPYTGYCEPGTECCRNLDCCDYAWHHDLVCRLLCYVNSVLAPPSPAYV